VAQVTLEVIEKDPTMQLAPRWVRVLLAWLFQGVPPRLLLSRSLFAHLRRRGVPVLFLGVNTEEHVELAHRYGATAVLTDRVEWLCNHMKDNNIQFVRIE
jgi:hypothetical protein